MITNGAAQWWSATGTWRLLRCPASAVPAQAPTKPPARAPDNAGAVAHIALQNWTESGEWSGPDPGTRLQARFDEVAGAHGISPGRIPQAAVTRARLKARGQELAEIFALTGVPIRSEQLLSDQSHGLFGILDIAATGNHGLVVDLKTGRDASAESWPAIEHQMTSYAHLFQATYGTLPQHVIVFTLQRGPTEIRVTPTEVAALLERVHAAQASNRTEARPEPDICRFCPKRTTCQPHWEAVSAWEHADAIEGEIRDVEHASSGLSAIQIGSQWLTGIPKRVMPVGAGPGQHARAIRVRRRDDRPRGEWIASSNSRVTVVTQVGMSPW